MRLRGCTAVTTLVVRFAAASAHYGTGSASGRSGCPLLNMFQRRREHERAQEAARRLCYAVDTRRAELLDSLRELNRLEALAHGAGPSEPGWDILALVYGELPAVAVELFLLEHAGVSDLLSLLTDRPVCSTPFTNSSGRRQIVDSVLSAAGLYDAQGRFVEFCP